ncbi:F-box only protein 28-like isoform X1 [Centruroides sculpturatus]|uniref:F-box only protein 28-like isoform X1 n=1 Tax=Centruroides sculpturatus TaxID=218467 RepID=UPI000C6C9BE8|nr:F-box only protein 28-like isoform X1 [Centruroides sculpturatus]XP_023222460.1 F-box only protein 28-like isoform X1 [Centruroides sculpturatus]
MEIIPANNTRELTLCDLPLEVIEIIFRWLSFETIGKIRLVCRIFNNICSSILNKEFHNLRILMQQRFQSIKAQMPRRESARRKHPLARESDIIETLHMRLTLLQMAFGKHIERRHCCFFAGEILDEVYRILRYVKTTPCLSRAYKVTDELFDLSTMAMEYFKEHIENTLPEITYFATDFIDYTPSLSSSPKTQLSLLDDPATSTACSPTKPVTGLDSLPPPSPVSPAVNKRLKRLRENMKRNNGQVLAVKQELKLTKRRVTSQQKQIKELKARFEDYDKKFQNTSRKLSAVLQDLSRCKTELQYWRSKSPASLCSCGKITPILELKDGKNPAILEGDENIGDGIIDIIDEFKPINAQLENVSSDNGPFVVVPARHSTPLECLHINPILTPLSPSKSLLFENFPTDDEISAGEESSTEKRRHKTCKRKLEMDNSSNEGISKHKIQNVSILDDDEC